VARRVEAVIVRSTKVPGMNTIRPLDGGNPKALFAGFRPGQHVLIVPAEGSTTRNSGAVDRSRHDGGKADRRLIERLLRAGVSRDDLQEMWRTARDTWIVRLLGVCREDIRAARRALRVAPYPRGGDARRDDNERAWARQWAWVAERYRGVKAGG